MGTLSKRPLKDFGHDVKERIEDMRTSVGSRIDQLGAKSGQEGRRTKGIERVTASVPSTAWLALAGASIAAAATLKLMGRDSAANFIGQWAPTILILGVYNKLVKVVGSERTVNAR
jgi:hypothetical protein